MNMSFSRALGAGLLLVLGLLAGGCDAITMPSLSLPNTDSVESRRFSDPPEKLYNASRAALEAMNYTFVRGSRASGKLEMASRVLPGSALLTRQRQVRVSIEELEGGQSEVHVAILETSEDESAGGTRTATNRVVRDSTAYGAFWTRLDEQLKIADAQAGSAAQAEDTGAGGTP